MEYQEINFLGDGLFAVKKNGLWGVINISGQVVVPLNYQNVTGRYGSAFIVTDYREQYRNKPKGDEPTYLGDLWKHQGIVGVGGKVLVNFEKYQKISVDTAGRFTCSVWTGGYRTGGYIGIGESLIPTYANEYTYEYINYKDLNVSDDVSSITAPTVPSTPTSPTTPITFSCSDVPANAYYATPVKWAVSNNITNGTSNTTFTPDRTCTTAEILTFLYRAMRGSGTTSAGDMDEAVKWAKEEGMIGSTFNGNTPCTRYTAVSYIPFQDCGLILLD